MRNVVTLNIHDDARGIHQTLTAMAKLAREYHTDMRVHDKARELVFPLPQKDEHAEIAAIHYFCNEVVRYVKDPVGMEWVQTPAMTLEVMQGDCDDKSTLCASLLMAIGHECRFVAVGHYPGTYSHVYVETQIEYKGGGKWIPLECTIPGWPPGVAPGGMKSYMRVPI